MDISIGCSLIAKNEETNIHRALNSVLPVVSQIVVVDTGSEDTTPQICSRYGAEIHYFKWADDFSEARNYALSFMRTDWILSIDADEELDIKSFSKNNNLLKINEVGGVKVKIKNILGDKTEFSQHSYTRIFRRDINIRFKGKIHEQIASSILDCGFHTLESDIIINHYGYSEINEEKISRNKKLLVEEIKENPNDDWLIYHLAETEFAGGDLILAKVHFQKILNSKNLSFEQIEMVWIRLGQIALKNNDFEFIKQLNNFKCRDESREGLRLFILLSYLLSLRKFEEAHKLYKNPLIQNSNLISHEIKTQTKTLFDNLTLDRF